MTAYNILIKFLPRELVAKILEFNFPKKRWVRYWKNQTMGLIEGGRMIVSTPFMIRNMNDIYLDNLTYDVLSNHIGILEEISHICENIANPDFNILMDAIRYNIRKTLRISLR